MQLLANFAMLTCTPCATATKARGHSSEILDAVTKHTKELDRNTIHKVGCFCGRGAFARNELHFFVQKWKFSFCKLA